MSEKKYSLEVLHCVWLSGVVTGVGICVACIIIGWFIGVWL